MWRTNHFERIPRRKNPSVDGGIYQVIRIACQWSRADDDAAEDLDCYEVGYLVLFVAT
jgi:hypothetical protein